MRYYSTTAGEMVLQTAVSAGDTTITVDTTSGLPVSFPYTLILDYGAGAEEVVDVTAAAGTTLTVSRGKDGTVAQSHDFGAKIRHGVTARDYRESREHEDATGAHGVAEVVGVDEAQTLDNKTFEPDGDHAAITVRTDPANAEPAVNVVDSANARRAAWYETGLSFFNGANVVARIRQGGAVSLFKAILELRVSDDVHSVVGTVSGTPTGKFLRLVNAAVDVFTVAANGDLTARAGTFTSNVGVTGNVTASGTVSSGGATVATRTGTETLTNKTISGSSNTLSNIATSAITGLVTSLNGIWDRLDALETNLGSQTTFAATSSGKDGKKIHWGVASIPTGDASGYRTVTHGAGFTPTVATGTLSGPFRLSIDNITSTTFRLQIVQTDGSAYVGFTGTLYYFCGE